MAKLICSIALAAALFAPAAQAFRGVEMNCTDFASVGQSIADTRDAGIPWSEFGPFIRSKLGEARQNPLSYIASQEDVEFAMFVFSLIYTERPANVERWAYAICMAKPGPATHRKRRVTS